jgi:hypothetical protein
LLGLLTALVWAIPLSAGEDDIQQKWESPDGQFIMRHGLASDFGIVASAPEDEKAAAYVLTGKGAKLWTGISFVDESARSFRCLWSPDSKFVLLLDRPARGDVRLFVVRTDKPELGGLLKIEKLIAQRMLEAGDANVRSPVVQKTWFGAWNYEKGQFTGVLVVAKERYHRFVLSIDPAAEKPEVKIISERAEEIWTDGLGAF